MPLSATVDYHGFRVICTSVLPTNLIKYGDRRCDRSRKGIGSWHGRSGEVVHNDSSQCNNLLAGIARKLNLAAHNVKGSKDLNPKAIHAGVDVRAYKVGRRQIWVESTYGNCLPGESNWLSEHLPVAPEVILFFGGC